MENAQKRQRWSAFMTVLLLALLAQVFQSYTLPQQTETVCDCMSPYNLALTDVTSSSISADWDVAGSPDGFKVWYYRREDNYTSQPITTNNPYHTFSGLASGTYDIHVVAVCGLEYSGGIVMVDIIL